jgi:uncharacterized protein
VNLVDANVLLYSVNEDDPKHERARLWLDHELSGNGTVGFAWIVLLAFLRLATKHGLFPRPLEVGQAIETVRVWTDSPQSVLLHASPRHLEILSDLVSRTGTGGNLVNDAHLAALAVEHRATVVTFDTDFGRFKGVRWVEPPER